MMLQYLDGVGTPKKKRRSGSIVSVSNRFAEKGGRKRKGTRPGGSPPNHFRVLKKKNRGRPGVEHAGRKGKEGGKPGQFLLLCGPGDGHSTGKVFGCPKIRGWEAKKLTNGDIWGLGCGRGPERTAAGSLNAGFGGRAAECRTRETVQKKIGNAPLKKSFFPSSTVPSPGDPLSKKAQRKPQKRSQPKKKPRKWEANQR